MYRNLDSTFNFGMLGKRPLNEAVLLETILYDFYQWLNIHVKEFFHKNPSFSKSKNVFMIYSSTFLKINKKSRFYYFMESTPERGLSYLRVSVKDIAKPLQEALKIVVSTQNYT